MDEVKEFQKDMFRNRKERYRKNHKTITLSFSLEKAKGLEAEAKKHGKNPPEFLKCLLDASLQGTGYVLPKDSKLQELLLALRRVGNNINQLVKHIHTEGILTQKDLEQMQKHLMELEKEMKTALAKPSSMSDILIEHLIEHPEALQPLILWLNQYEHDNKGTPS